MYGTNPREYASGYETYETPEVTEVTVSNGSHDKKFRSVANS
jgi:hypothetical protein